MLAAFQRSAFQNNAFQVGSDYLDGDEDGDAKKKRRAWRLEDLYDFSKKNASPQDQKKLSDIVKPFERTDEKGVVKIEFEEIAIHPVGRVQIANYIQELYNTRQELKDRILRLINAEFLKQRLEADKKYEENFFIFLLLMED